jgi:hypothetical protein
MWRRAVVAVICAAGTVVMAGPAWAASTVPVGTATIVSGSTGLPINSGGSATLYGINVPSGSKCQGDTAHDGYSVFTYMVPKGTDPASETYTDVPAKGFGLIASEQYVGGLATDPISGDLQSMPGNFTFSRLTPAILFGNGATSATFEAGVACVRRGGFTSAYWNVEVVFTRSTTDPGGFVWHLTRHESRPSSTGRTVLIVVVGVVAGGTVYILISLFGVARRRSRTAPAA